jgi:threonine synthase
MPFCPQCRFEYEAEVKVCPECGVPLEAELPPEEPAEQEGEEVEWQELVTVYSALEYGDVSVRESLLQASGIPTFISNEFTVYAPLLTEGFHLQVPQEYAEQAVAILGEGEHLAEPSEAVEFPSGEEMDLPEMDDDGEV